MLKEGRSNGVREIVGYLGVGVAGASLYILLSTLLHSTGIVAWTASVTGYLICIPIVYLAQRNIAFQSEAAYFSSFLKYAAAQATSLSLAAALPYLLVTRGQMRATVSFVLVGLVGACVNFALLKFWAFADDPRRLSPASSGPQ